MTDTPEKKGRFKRQNLHPLAYTSAFTLWYYKASDDDAFDHAGFFNPAQSTMREGDRLIVGLPGLKTRDFTVTKVEKGLVIVKPVGKEHLFAPGEPRDKLSKGESEDGASSN